jgi:hypothetical protein
VVSTSPVQSQKLTISAVIGRENLDIRLHPSMCNMLSFDLRKRIESLPFSKILSCSVEMFYNLGAVVLSQRPN